MIVSTTRFKNPLLLVTRIGVRITELPRMTHSLGLPINNITQFRVGAKALFSRTLRRKIAVILKQQKSRNFKTHWSYKIKYRFPSIFRGFM